MSYYIFRYGEEYRCQSNLLNTREWNYYAKWKFRELNELNILYQERLNESYKYATNYVKQFQRNKIAVKYKQYQSLIYFDQSIYAFKVMKNYHEFLLKIEKYSKSSISKI